MPYPEAGISSTCTDQEERLWSWTFLSKKKGSNEMRRKKKAAVSSYRVSHDMVWSFNFILNRGGSIRKF